MYRGLVAKMETQEFLWDLGLMCDTLEEISHLSLSMQERGMTLTTADKLMRPTIRTISISSHDCHGIPLTTSPRARQIDSSVFLHSLIENLEDWLFCTGSSRNPSVSAENSAHCWTIVKSSTQKAGVSP